MILGVQDEEMFTDCIGWHSRVVLHPMSLIQPAWFQPSLLRSTTVPMAHVPSYGVRQDGVPVPHTVTGWPRLRHSLLLAMRFMLLCTCSEMGKGEVRGGRINDNVDGLAEVGNGQSDDKDG